jgi:hypothetical protein
MILHLIATLSILLIAYIQMKQGLFSSLIMAMCCLVAALVAVGYFDGVAVASGLMERLPDIATAISLSILFIVTLLSMRCLLDKIISIDVLFGQWVNRIGASIFGLFSGTVIVGICVMIFQMCPLAPDALGYQPYTDDLADGDRMFPFEPELVVDRLIQVATTGGLRGPTPFTDHHDNLLREAYCNRNRAGQEGRRDAPTGTFDLLEAYNYDNIKNVMETPPLMRPEGTKRIVVRVTIGEDAAGRGEKPWWRLPATQFKLTCRTGEKGPIANYYPIAYLYKEKAKKQVFLVESAPEADGKPQVAQLIVMRPVTSGKTERGGMSDDTKERSTSLRKKSSTNLRLVVDWVYSIPQDARPVEITFRRTQSEAIESVLPKGPAVPRQSLRMANEDDTKSRRRRR